MTLRFCDVGQLIVLPGMFETDGQVADPSFVYFDIKEPDGVETTYQYGVDTQVVKEATGRYHVSWSVTKAGPHFYGFRSTGTNQGAKQGAFIALAWKPNP